MAFSKKQLDPKVQEWLRKVAAEGRELLYGPAAYPEWGTKFSQIEQEGMSVGLELARLVIQQSVAKQAEHMPAAAGSLEDDVALPAGKEATTIETEAGKVDWEEPRARLKQGRKAFFPPTESPGAGGRRRPVTGTG
jgi:predicted enzyme related to lactoylglutathione lyase